MKRFVSVTLLLFLLGCATPSQTIPQVKSVATSEGTPAGRILGSIGEIVRTWDKSKGTPVVVFDLDDTLFDARTRTQSVLRDMVKQPEVARAIPDAVPVLAYAPLEKIHYSMEDTFSDLKITDSVALDKAKDHFMRWFFSNAYCAVDSPLAGAAAYVRQLHSQGAHIVYLSGRDYPRMEKCSREALAKHGFPLGKKAELLLKQKHTEDDFAFKKRAMERIHKLGPVAAVFENEPKNLNLLADKFPRSAIVFVDTQHSPAPDVPTPHAHWIKDFLAADVLPQVR